MLQIDLVGWIVVGFLAGWLSGVVVHRGGPRGCLADVVVGVLGGLLGGWLARELRLGDPQGFSGALIVAFLGAVLLRLILDALQGDHRDRRW